MQIEKICFKKITYLHNKLDRVIYLYVFQGRILFSYKFYSFSYYLCFYFCLIRNCLQVNKLNILFYIYSFFFMHLFQSTLSLNVWMMQKNNDCMVQRGSLFIFFVIFFLFRFYFILSFFLSLSLPYNNFYITWSGIKYA